MFLKSRVISCNELVEQRVLGPMPLVTGSTRVRVGIPCHSNRGHDSHPCDPGMIYSLLLTVQSGKSDGGQCRRAMNDRCGHKVRIHSSDFNGSFQVADIHKIELHGSERH